MNTCKSCGGQLNRSGNYYVCEFCGNRWEIDSSNDVHAVDRANAWSALRDVDFQKAAELFENIIVKESDNHEAYWGRALALAGIVYVTDMNENKKIPTCNNITEESFVDSKDVQKAISLAPADIAEGYKAQAEYIEKVRIEWLEKASKEPAYDVFISFKDSDRENGIERTQDSIDAQDLYNALVAEGYKVFFSRISLRDKISEQYEPYIYNAIKTAKVMIVFGEKAEYFSSVWIKNEWSRFKNRIVSGEKHKNSLVVVYKNLNPGDLPVVLKSRQCMNAADMTFLSDLNRHIKRVIEETKNIVQLERVEIVSGQIAVKATKINEVTTQTRALGEGASPETSISEQQTLSLAAKYLEHNDFDKAKQLAEDILFENPGNPLAVRLEFFAKHSVAKESNFEKLKSFDDYAGLHKFFTCVDKKNAVALLNSIYKMREMSEREYAKLLHEILPYIFDGREQYIEELFSYATECRSEEIFAEILPTISEDAVDDYISKLYLFASAMAADKNKRADVYIQKILECDAGHKDTLKLRLSYDIQMGTDSKTMVAHIKEMLQYAENMNITLAEILQLLCSAPATERLEVVCNQSLKFYEGELSRIEKQLEDIAFWLIRDGLVLQAEYYLRLVLGFNKNNLEVFKALCMIKANVRSWDKIAQSETVLSDIPEFDKYMSLCSEKEQDELLKTSKNNRRYFLAKKQMLLDMRQTCSQDFLIDANGNVIAKPGVQVSYWKENRNESRYAYLLDALKWKNIVSIHNDSNTIIGLRSDGTVAVSSSRAYIAEIRNWNNIIAIAHDSSFFIICGLKNDGTVCVAADKFHEKHADIVKAWENIEAVSVCDGDVFGLRADGIVLHSFRDYLRSEKYGKGDIIAISGGVALHLDGTVSLPGKYNSVKSSCNRWKDIVSIYGVEYKYACVSMDGKVKIGSSDDSYFRKSEKTAESWENVVALGFGGYSINALCADGSAKIVCEDDYVEFKNVAEVCAAGIILKDGTFATVYFSSGPKVRLKPEINTWEDYNSYKREIWELRSGANNVEASGGCYIATCVYGSYDCAPVWVLRRYRDQKLMKTKIGKLFVRFYYAVSPFVVRKFGAYKWFHSVWKNLLDRFVLRLESSGIADAPYQDE